MKLFTVHIPNLKLAVVASSPMLNGLVTGQFSAMKEFIPFQCGKTLLPYI